MNTFFCDNNIGIFKIEHGRTARLIIADRIENDIVFDGDNFFYIASDHTLKYYHIANGETGMLCGDTITPYSLYLDKDKLHFETIAGEREIEV